MATRIERYGHEDVIYGDPDALLHVTNRVWLLGNAFHGVHVHPGGTLTTSGIINNWLQVDADAVCYTSGLIHAQPLVAESGLLDIRGWLTIARLRREQPGALLLAVGARYNDHVLQPDGTLTPRTDNEGGEAPEVSPRYRIVSGGREPVLASV
ncbi:hypothetical protein [Microbacterium lacticum]